MRLAAGCWVIKKIPAYLLCSVSRDITTPVRPTDAALGNTGPDAAASSASGPTNEGGGWRSGDHQTGGCCPVPLQWAPSSQPPSGERERDTIRTNPTQLGQEAVSGRIISWGWSPVGLSQRPDNWQNIFVKFDKYFLRQPSVAGQAVQSPTLITSAGNFVL